jgi:CheY-like chemotaxis protein
MSEGQQLTTGEEVNRSFRDLMRGRITEILLVSSPYDSFIMEEDGGLVEQISSKYLDLHLSRAPRLKRVSTAAEAFKALEKRRFDLVVTMKHLEDMDAASFSREVKNLHPKMPVVLLLHRMSDVVTGRAQLDAEDLDRVFVWSGDSGVFLAMVKSVEDEMNIDADIAAANVRAIVLVEDSPLHISSFLPLLYQEVMRFCQAVLPEDINTMHRLYRMRARPKILVARNYEEGRELCNRYRDNILAVISDIQIPQNGEMTEGAGLALRQETRDAGLRAPYLFLSSSEEYQQQVLQQGARFVSKNSPSLAYELRDFISERLGFGDFVFRLPGGSEVGRAEDISDFDRLLEQVPDQSLQYHLDKGHFLNWFLARGEFSLAQAVENGICIPVSDLPGARLCLSRSIARNAVDRRRGRISDFSSQGLDNPDFLMRMGRGSLGGKARGLAFIDHVMEQLDFENLGDMVEVRLPRTIAIGVEEFEAFISENKLRRFFFDEYNEEEVAEAFLAARLPQELIEGIDKLLAKVKYPLAVRSSSLLEDSHNVPFAGIYSTYMLPNNDPDISVRREQLHRAIKLVYASVLFDGARKYLKSVNVRLAEEKMGIIIQEMVGRRHDSRFYPDVSGVAHSYNFYPGGRMKPEDGVAHVALGLGKIVTDDGESLRFCPANPKVLPQFNSIKDYFDLTQKKFYALDMSDSALMPIIDDGADLITCTLECAEADGALQHMGAVFSADDNAIREGLRGSGPRLVTFGNILKHKSFPLAAILREFLRIGREGMGCPVEIEYALTLPPGKDQAAVFNILQIRPMFSAGEVADIDLGDYRPEELLCNSRSTLSNGEFTGITDIIYVPPERFDELKTCLIASEFGQLNDSLFSRQIPYIAIGLGRWGTSESSLGIPVNWSQICGAKALIETGRDDYVIDPSHGTHFFQNLTSLRVAFLSVQPRSDIMDWDWLAAQELVEELQFVRHVRTSSPIKVLVDGRKQVGVVLKG